MNTKNNQNGMGSGLGFGERPTLFVGLAVFVLFLLVLSACAPDVNSVPQLEPQAEIEGAPEAAIAEPSFSLAERIQFQDKLANESAEWNLNAISASNPQAERMQFKDQLAVNEAAYSLATEAAGGGISQAERIQFQDQVLAAGQGGDSNPEMTQADRIRFHDSIGSK